MKRAYELAIYRQRDKDPFPHLFLGGHLLKHSDRLLYVSPPHLRVGMRWLPYN